MWHYQHVNEITDLAESLQQGGKNAQTEIYRIFCDTWEKRVNEFSKLLYLDVPTRYSSNYNYKGNIVLIQMLIFQYHFSHSNFINAGQMFYLINVFTIETEWVPTTM